MVDGGTDGFSAGDDDSDVDDADEDDDDQQFCRLKMRRSELRERTKNKNIVGILRSIDKSFLCRIPLTNLFQ